MTPAQTLVREQARAMREGLEKVMEQQLRAVGIPFEREFQFAPPRRWRFDFIVWRGLPRAPVAVEVEGGTWVGGRHGTGTGMAKDCEKYSEAAILGWRVLRATTNQVRDGTALRWIERALTT